MTQPISISFQGTADFTQVTGALAALNQSLNGLQKRMQSLSSLKLNSQLSRSVQSIAQPKFDWDLGLKQADKMVQLLQKNKLAANSYFDSLKNIRTISRNLANEQVRLSNALTTTGKNGMWQMYIPPASAVANLASKNELLNRTLSIQGEMLGAIGTKIQNWGKNAQWAGRQLMVGWTMPFAAAAAATAFYTYDIDKQLTRIEKVYDGSQKNLRAMAMETSKSITQTMGTSTKDNLDVMAQMAAVGKTGVELQRSTAEVQRLTTLGEMDRMQALQAVITLQSTFKMSTEQTAEAINYMNAVENATSLSMSDFAEALPRAAAPVAELGGSLQELGTIMVAMKERGIEAGEGANAIKTLMTRMLSPTREAQKLFQQLTGKDLVKFVETTGGKLMPTLAGLSDIIKNSNLSLLDQQRLVSELGGAWQSTRLTSILQGLASESGQVAKAMDLAGASAESLADKAGNELSKQTSSLSGQFDIALNTFLTEFEEFGQLGLRVATIVLKTGKAVMEFFNSLPDGVKTLLVMGAALAAIAGPLVMIVGLAANLGGVFTKTLGGLFRVAGGYKSMTLEQKAAQLATDQFNKRLMTQADMVQVLVYQLDKLQRAYMVTQNASSAVPLPGGNTVIQHPNGTWQRYNEQTGKYMGAASRAEASQAQAILQAQAGAAQNVATQTQKASIAQKAFGQNTLLAVSGLTAVASIATDTGSTLNKWLTYISMITAGITLLYPVIEGAITRMKALGAAQGLAGGAASTAKNIGSKLMGGLGTAAGFLTGPWGLAIAAAGLTAVGIYQAVTAASDKQLEKQKALNESTDGWAKSLGFVKAEIGQIRKESGDLQDTMQSLVEKMKKDNAAVVDEMRNLSGDPLMNRIRREVYKLETQGIAPTEIQRGMEAALKAAGKTKAEIEKIMKDIKMSFDFGNTKKDIDQFVNDIQNDISNSMKYRGQYQGDPGFWDANYSVTGRGKQGIQENAKVFYERLTQLDPAQQAYVVAQMKTKWDKIQQDFLSDIKKKHPGIKQDATWDQLLNQFTNFSPETGFTNKLNNNLSIEIANSANAMREFVVAFGNLQGLSKDKVLGLKTFNDLLKYVDIGSMSATDAVKAYDDSIQKLEASGVKLTDEQKKQIAEMYASAAGLDAAKLAAGGYSKQQVTTADTIQDTINKLNIFVNALNAARGASNDFWSSRVSTNGFELLGADPAAQAQSLTSTVKDIYSGTMNTIYDVFGAQMEQQFTARMQSIADAFEARKSDLERQAKDLDKSWDNRFKDSEREYKNRRKAIEDTADAEQKAIEDQIKAIKNQQDAEQELEDARQKQFEAEERRLQRLNEMANRNIDYNRALAEGNLDEAARIQNNMSSQMSSWATEDAMLASQAESDARKKEQDMRIAALEERKQLINEEKQAKLEQLTAEQEAVKESMQAQQELEKERLQNRINSLQQEQQAVEASERSKQDMDRRTLEIQLATLKAFVPKNEAELWAHIGKVQEAYGQHGVELTVKGGQWGQIIGDALQNNVNRARVEMSNDNAWANFGASVAAAITQGAFGMDLGSFFNMLVTGKPPEGWTPPGTSTPYKNSLGMQTRHAGGPAGMGRYNNRLGRKGNPQGDEYPTLLQRGEYVINKNAASKLGPGYLDAINSGKTPGGFGIGGASVGMAGLFGAMAGYMMGQLINATFLGSQKQQSQPGWSGNIAQQAGNYGGYNLDADQLNNANIIANVGKQMGASQRDIVIALMTAMQESTLRNLNYGDRDSLGLFQQRPSQGWGSAAQVTNPEYAARKFFETLFGVTDRNNMPLTLAAQAVQRSAFPYAYEKWQSMAEALVGAGVGSMADDGTLKFGLFKNLLGANTSMGLGTGKYAKPTNGVVTSEYGMRDGALHDGIDIGAPMGTPVFATDAGTVISAGWNNGGFGYWTLIDHGNGLISGYAHQNTIGINAGQKVGRGQLIGTVGSTGKSTGPHLHFQMGPGPGKFQNPRNWIPSLMTGGDILYDNVLANLHKDEKVLTAPLSSKLESGIDNMDKNSGDIYNVNINITGSNIEKPDVFEAVMSAIEQAQAKKDKRMGLRR